MEHRDAELSDIIVILDATCEGHNDLVVNQLKAMGMEIDSVNEEEGAIEGTVCTQKLPEIRKMKEVDEVRVVFNYVADYPPGDPRNLDKEEESDLPDAE